MNHFSNKNYFTIKANTITQKSKKYFVFQMKQKEYVKNQFMIRISLSLSIMELHY